MGSRRRSLLTMAVVAGLALAGSRTTLRASTIKVVDKTCPLCATAFKATLAYSGTRFGMYLDLQPIGPICAPWPVAVCPTCGFVVLEEALDAATLARLRRYVDTPVYRAYASQRASYFRLAKIRLAIGRDELDLAHTYLMASWQESGAFWREDVEFSLRHFEAYLAQRGATAPDPTATAEAAAEELRAYQTAQAVKGEILRRLGRFDDALAHFTVLQKDPAMQDGVMPAVITYQISLCQKQDSERHDMDEAQSGHKSQWRLGR